MKAFILLIGRRRISFFDVFVIVLAALLVRDGWTLCAGYVLAAGLAHSIVLDFCVRKLSK